MTSRVERGSLPESSGYTGESVLLGDQNRINQVAGSVLQNPPQAQENMTVRHKWTVIGFSVLFGSVLYHMGQMCGIAAMQQQATMYNVSWALYLCILAAQCAWLFIMLPGQIKVDNKKT